LLGKALSFLRTEKRDVIVLGIPRGGVIIAKEVADALDAPVDVVITRKIGAPGDPELAIGAVTLDGEVITDPVLMELLGVSNDFMKKETTSQLNEIERRMKAYRGDRSYPDLSGKAVVIVDDGVATGSTIQAAIQSIRRKGAAVVILGVPVGPPDTVARLSKVADQVVCLRTPEPFHAIGEFYAEFDQVDDDTVKEVLRTMREAR